MFSQESHPKVIFVEPTTRGCCWCSSRSAGRLGKGDQKKKLSVQFELVIEGAYIHRAAWRWL